MKGVRWPGNVARNAFTPYDVSDARIQTTYPVAKSPRDDDCGELLAAYGSVARSWRDSLVRD